MREPRRSAIPQILANVVTGLLRARRGESGRPSIETAQRLVGATDELQRLVPVALARAEIEWLDGDRDAVRTATDPVLALAVDRRAAWALGELTSWRLRAGVDDGVDAVVAEQFALQRAKEHRR